MKFVRISMLCVVSAFAAQADGVSGMSFITTRQFQSDEYYNARSEFYVALAQFDLENETTLKKINDSSKKCGILVDHKIQEDGVFLIEACAGLANVLFKVNENVALNESEYKLLIVHSSDQNACIGEINLKSFLEKNRDRINVKRSE